jgi:hypothetical protein
MANTNTTRALEEKKLKLELARLTFLYNHSADLIAAMYHEIPGAKAWIEATREKQLAAWEKTTPQVLVQ